MVDRVKGGLLGVFGHVGPGHGQGFARGARVGVRQETPVKGDGQPPGVFVAHGVAHGDDLGHSRLQQRQGGSRVAAGFLDRVVELFRLGGLGSGLQRKLFGRALLPFLALQRLLQRLPVLHVQQGPRMAGGEEEYLRDEPARFAEQRHERLAGDAVVGFALEVQRVVVPVAAPVNDVVTAAPADRFLEPRAGDAVAEHVDFHVAVGEDPLGEQLAKLLALAPHGQGAGPGGLGKDGQDAEGLAFGHRPGGAGDLHVALGRVLGDRPDHEVLRPGAVGQPSDVPGHAGERGGQHVLVGRG